MLKALAATSLALSRAAKFLSFGGLIAMTIVIAWQVIARYGLNAAPSWTEQAALFVMLWFLLFAAAAGVREGFHIRLTLLDEKLKSRAALLRIFCHVVVLAFGAAMCWSGGALVLATWSHVLPTLGVPRGLAYLPIPISGALIVLFSIEHIIIERSGESAERAWK